MPTGLWIGRVGTLQYLDELAEKFVKTTNGEERAQLLELARQFQNTVTEDDHIKSAMYYIRILVSDIDSKFQLAQGST